MHIKYLYSDVIPAKAGTQENICAPGRLDSRFRGNDNVDVNAHRCHPRAGVNAAVDVGNLRCQANVRGNDNVDVNPLRCHAPAYVHNNWDIGSPGCHPRAGGNSVESLSMGQQQCHPRAGGDPGKRSLLTSKVLKTIKAGRYFLLAPTLALLAGCSSMLTSNENISETYTLNAANQFPEAIFNIDQTIVVETPLTSAGLNTNKIMLKITPQAFDFYAGARWAEALPQMAQTSLIESLENSRNLSRVAGDRSTVRGDYLLSMEIRDFQAEYPNGAKTPTVHIKVVTKLIHFPDRTLAATFTAETWREVEANNLQDIAAAFDQSFIEVQTMIVNEVLDYFVE